MNSGSLQYTNNLTVGQNLTVKGTLTAENFTQIYDTVEYLTVSEQLTVDKDATFGGILTVGAAGSTRSIGVPLEPTTVISAGSITTSVQVTTGSLAISDGINPPVAGFDALGNLGAQAVVAGDVTATFLSVTNDTTLNGSLTVDSISATTLTVSGDTSLSTLNVSSNLTAAQLGIYDNGDFVAGIDASGKLTITGNTELGSDAQEWDSLLSYNQDDIVRFGNPISVCYIAGEDIPYVVGNPSPPNDLRWVETSFTSTNVIGDLIVQESLRVNSITTLTLPVTIISDLTVSGTVSSGNIVNTFDTTLGGSDLNTTLTVNSVSTFNSAITANDDLTVTGNSTLGDNGIPEPQPWDPTRNYLALDVVTYLSPTGDYWTPNTSVPPEQAPPPDAQEYWRAIPNPYVPPTSTTINGDSTLTTLFVTGNTELGTVDATPANTVTINGDLTITGKINPEGGATFDALETALLTVTGDTVLGTADTDPANTVTINGDLTVTGKINDGGISFDAVDTVLLTVTGDTELGTADAEPVNTVTINGDLTVTGKINDGGITFDAVDTVLLTVTGDSTLGDNGIPEPLEWDDTAAYAVGDHVTYVGLNPEDRYWKAVAVVTANPAGNPTPQASTPGTWIVDIPVPAPVPPTTTTIDGNLFISTFEATEIAVTGDSTLGTEAPEPPSILNWSGFQAYPKDQYVTYTPLPSPPGELTYYISKQVITAPPPLTVPLYDALDGTYVVGDFVYYPSNITPPIYYECIQNQDPPAPPDPPAPDYFKSLGNNPPLPPPNLTPPTDTTNWELTTDPTPPSNLVQINGNLTVTQNSEFGTIIEPPEAITEWNGLFAYIVGTLVYYTLPEEPLTFNFQAIVNIPRPTALIPTPAWVTNTPYTKGDYVEYNDLIGQYWLCIQTTAGTATSPGLNPTIWENLGFEPPLVPNNPPINNPAWEEYFFPPVNTHTFNGDLIVSGSTVLGTYSLPDIDPWNEYEAYSVDDVVQFVNFGLTLYYIAIQAVPESEEGNPPPTLAPTFWGQTYVQEPDTVLINGDLTIEGELTAKSFNPPFLSTSYITLDSTTNAVTATEGRITSLNSTVTGTSTLAIVTCEELTISNRISYTEFNNALTVTIVESTSAVYGTFLALSGIVNVQISSGSIGTANYTAYMYPPDGYVVGPSTLIFITRNSEVAYGNVSCISYTPNMAGVPAPNGVFYLGLTGFSSGNLVSVQYIIFNVLSLGTPAPPP